MIAGLIPGALQSDAADVRIEALRAMAILQENGVPETITALAIPLLEDPDARIREAAVLAGPSGVDWRALLTREGEPAVRRALIRQLARSAGEDAIPDLIAFLATDDWQVRAFCAEALVSLGDSVVEKVKPLVSDADQSVRVAAVRILLDLQQDTWLKQEFVIKQ
jgi:HEAT repeat protein